MKTLLTLFAFLTTTAFSQQEKKQAKVHVSAQLFSLTPIYQPGFKVGLSLSRTDQINLGYSRSASAFSSSSWNSTLLSWKKYWFSGSFYSEFYTGFVNFENSDRKISGAVAGLALGNRWHIGKAFFIGLDWISLGLPVGKASIKEKTSSDTLSGDKKKQSNVFHYGAITPYIGLSF